MITYSFAKNIFLMLWSKNVFTIPPYTLNEITFHTGLVITKCAIWLAFIGSERKGPSTKDVHTPWREGGWPKVYDLLTMTLFILWTIASYFCWPRLLWRRKIIDCNFCLPSHSGEKWFLSLFTCISGDFERNIYFNFLFFFCLNWFLWIFYFKFSCFYPISK